ncbi:prenyltransferase/squalene oxidase repeat-containing protein [Thermococcus sp. 21S7]|uniref:prenyltransferase/squalene oxidase repeat-containing protein n=1 Tax=Thermococcus sp. 21S7 TaxID=1638221 RepID=UPI00143BE9FD|nr:prenyltransferase/squalene oxidase repeat-containing protein [Thermococcus sp. 21S7]NJE62026.1 hypothetical protein [Thermococcus sp. 21S7]
MKKRIIAVLMLFLVLSVSYTSASVLDDSWWVLVSMSSGSTEIPEKALILTALGESVGKVQNTSDVLAEMESLSRDLIEYQNPDGGWGHFENEVSSVPPTAYSLIALNLVKSLGNEYSQLGNIKGIDTALRAGERFLLDSFNGEGWGYIPGTKTELYPTLLAIWALGEMGYTYGSSIQVDRAVKYVNSIDELTPRELALKLIAFKSVEHPADRSDIERCRKLLTEPSLGLQERAYLTYALTLYEPFSFETAKALLYLETIGTHNRTFYIQSQPGPLLYTDTAISTAYAVMAFAQVSDRVSEVSNPRAELCDSLVESQNPDGGWGLYPGDASSAKATYYAIRALSKCTRASDSVAKAVEWAKAHLEDSRETAERAGTVTEDYYYTLKILAEFGEKAVDQEKEVQFIENLSYRTGLWRGAFAIPQPSETAMALDLLLDLGLNGSEPYVRNAKEWLLSITPDGWGLIISHSLGVMVGKNVPVTLTVLEALTKVSSKEELAPHLKWLASQELPDGAWGYFKESTNMLGEASHGTPSMEYTIRAINVLRSNGYNITAETLQWVLGNIDPSNMTNTEKALALEFLANIHFIPSVTLYEVVRNLGEGSWTIHAPGEYEKVAEVVRDSLEDLGAEVSLVNGTLGELNGNHIILAEFGAVNVSRYNGDVHVEVQGMLVKINGEAYFKDSTVAIIPGMTGNGYVLMVLFEKKTEDAVINIWKSELFRYLHGDYMVLKCVDRNHDGTIDPLEMEVLHPE